MKPNFLLLAGLAALLALTAPPLQATQLSPDRLDMLDKRGLFPPDFKKAVHDLVTTENETKKAREDEIKFKHDLPGLQKQVDEAAVITENLRKELSRYEHPDETDYAQLQKKMADTQATPQEQLTLAQAFVWGYPSNPHLAEVQQIVQAIQKKIADETQAEKDAEAARVAAHAKMIERAKTKELSLDEWREFLQDMSQEDVLKYLGRPTSVGDDTWIYSGAWTIDPILKQKVGLQIAFNAGRVLTIVGAPNSP